MDKLEKFNVSLEDMLKEKITLTSEAKKEADVSVLMDEIEKLDYSEQELKEGLEIFKELLDGIKENEEVNNYLKDLPDGNFHKVNQIQEWLESYYEKLVKNTPITAAARDDDDRKKEYTKFLKGFRLLGEVMRKKELDPIQLVGNLCTIADLNGVCASGWKYTLIELITRYRDDIQMKGVMDGVEKLEYKDEELHDGIASYRKMIEKIKDDKEVQNYLNELYGDQTNNINNIETNIEAIYTKLINNELSPKLEGDSKENYNKTVLNGLKLFGEYAEKKEVKPIDIIKNLIKISALNVENNEEKVRETLTNLLTQFPEEINKKLYNEIKISEETDKIKVRLNGIFFAARENVAKKLCYNLLNELQINVSMRPHYMDIYTKYLNKEYGLNLPELDVKDSFVEEESQEYFKIEKQFKEYLEDKDIDNLIVNDVCRQYSELLNNESKIRQEARDEVTDWANLYVEKNQLIGEVEDTSDFLMQCGYDDTLTKVRLKFIEELLVENGYIDKKYETRELTKEQIQNVIIKALRYCEKDEDLESVKNSIMNMIKDKLISKEDIFDILFQSNIADSSLDVAQFLQQVGVNFKNEKGLEMLKKCIRDKNILNMKILLSNGVNANALNEKYLREALIVAFNEEEKEMVELLLDKGADANTSIGWERLLVKACKNGNKEMVELLLDKGVDVNEGDGEALIIACKKGNKEIVELLIDRGANINAERYDGTPLRVACNAENKEIVELLLDKGVDVNEGDGEALIIACKRGNKEIVELLIDRGANINADGGRALIKACENRNKEMVELLINRGADVNIKSIYGGNPLCRVIEKGDREIAKLLIENGANIEGRDGYIPLNIAVEKGDKEMVNLLLEKGADPNRINRYGDTALFKAISKRDTEMLELLIKNGANINEKVKWGELPLNEAISLMEYAEDKDKEKMLEIIKLLAENGADFNISDYEGGYTPLSKAINSRNKEIIIELFIENGADIDMLSDKGNTPLNEAIRRRNRDGVELLISKGADLNKEDKSGFTPLMTACEEGDKGLVNLLLENKADINKQNKNGITALMVACKKQLVSIVKLLLGRGADVNKESKDDKTALMIACENKNKDTVELILTKGVDVNKKNKDGKTALMIAYEKKDVEMAKILIENGANIKDLEGLQDKDAKEFVKTLRKSNMRMLNIGKKCIEAKEFLSGVKQYIKTNGVNSINVKQIYKRKQGYKEFNRRLKERQRDNGRGMN